MRQQLREVANDDEGLGYRLNGERKDGVADLIDMAVDGGDGDPEFGRIGLAQFGM
jgi:hypothetical protein